MSRARVLSVLLALGAAPLTGCAGWREPPDELQQKLQSYYAAEASEEAGACPQPEIASIVRRKVLESGPERTLLRVRYSYFDPTREADATWQQVLLDERPCTGFAERDFTLERGRLGYKVIGMSGERRTP